jgi:hypothetical protein
VRYLLANEFGEALTDAEFEQCMRTMDRDDDGVVSFDELQFWILNPNRQSMRKSMLHTAGLKSRLETLRLAKKLSHVITTNPVAESIKLDLTLGKMEARKGVFVTSFEANHLNVNLQAWMAKHSSLGSHFSLDWQVTSAQLANQLISILESFQNLPQELQGEVTEETPQLCFHKLKNNTIRMTVGIPKAWFPEINEVFYLSLYVIYMHHKICTSS